MLNDGLRSFCREFITFIWCLLSTYRFLWNSLDLVWEIYQVNKFLAFILSIQSAKSFQFSHYMTFSLARSNRGAIVTSKIGVDAISRCAQYAFFSKLLQPISLLKWNVNSFLFHSSHDSQHSDSHTAGATATSNFRGNPNHVRVMIKDS